MFKKLVFNGSITILIYILCVFFFKTQRIIFPIFMSGAFIFCMFSTYKNVLTSFIPLTLLWIINLFLPGSKINNLIIYIIFTPITFLLGYYLKDKLLLFKVLYPVILFFIGFYGFINLWFFMENFNARDNMKAPEMKFNYLESEIRLDTIKNTIIVLDFWTTNCGVCFKKFPDFEKSYLNYKNNPDVIFYTVNIPVKRDTLGLANKMIGKYNYQFPKLFATSDTIPKQLGFNKYPHNIILKNGKIRFNGSFSINDKDIFLYKLENEIERFLNE